MGTDKKQEYSFSELDPRMKMVLVMVFTTATYLSSDMNVLIWNYTLIILLHLLRKLWKSAWKISLLFASFILIEYLVGLIPFKGISSALGMIMFFLQRMSVFFVMGAWMSTNLRISDFVTSMQNMHLPKGIIITLAVVFRYLPTLREEFRYITNTMKLRGVGVNMKNILFHPLKTSEYAIVPLIIRSITIADELAASAMTRGLDLETERTSYRFVRLIGWDILYTLLIITTVAGGLTVNSILQRG